MSSRSVLKRVWHHLKARPGFWFQIGVMIYVPFCIFQFVLLLFQNRLQTAMFENLDGGFPTMDIQPFMGFYIAFTIGYSLIGCFTSALAIEGMGIAERAENSTMWALFQSGVRKVPRLVGIGLILLGPLLAIYAVISLVISQDAQAMAEMARQGVAPDFPQTFLLIPCLVCGTFLLFIPLMAWTTFSSTATVLEEQPVIASIKTGLDFIRTHTSSVIRLGLLLILILILVGVLQGILVAPLSLTAMVPMQQAMRNCIETASEMDTIAACMQQVQQSPEVVVVEIISTFLGSIGTSVQSLVFLMSTSLLFYRLEVAPVDPELGP